MSVIPNLDNQGYTTKWYDAENVSDNPVLYNFEVGSEGGDIYIYAESY